MLQRVVKRGEFAPVPTPRIANSIAWFPRSATWSQSLYDGGYGPSNNAVDVEPTAVQPQEAERQRRKISAYYSKPLSLELGEGLLNLIIEERVVYPPDVSALIDTVYPLYSIYWRRDLRPETEYLKPIISKVDLLSLYLMPTNLFEHRPVRKLLSYFEELEGTGTRREKIEALESAVINRYGDVRVVRSERPILVRIDGRELSLKQIETDRSVTAPQAVRLYVWVQASAPWLRDPEAWRPFTDFIEGRMTVLLNDLMRERTVPPGRLNTKRVNHPDKECITCNRIRPDREFALCSHPICNDCQSSIGSAKCPYCNEQFVSDSVDDQFAAVVLENVKRENRLASTIARVKNQAANRAIEFDFSSGRVELFSGGKHK